MYAYEHINLRGSLSGLLLVGLKPRGDVCKLGMGDTAASFRAFLVHSGSEYTSYVRATRTYFMCVRATGQEQST